jgi:5-methyltetrahydrofolate--homocysteine methyltransferase
MGTQLIARGVEAGTCNDYLNIDSPDVVADVHKAYFEAGSDAVLTNTFGANEYALARHGFGDKVDQMPLGTLKPEELKEAFAEQARGLLGGGVDGFIIETMTALEEIEVAIDAVKSVSSNLPVFASMAFDAVGGDYRTMMGVGVEGAVSKIVSLGVDAVGFNCGTVSLDGYIELAGKFVSAVEAAGQDVIILAEPNAGKPELVEDKAVYNVSPEDFAAAAEKIHSAGVNILGGCCGTGPEHIAAVAKKLK